MTEDIWDEMVKKYGISGYTDSLIIVKYETFIDLHKKAELWDQYAIYDNDKEEEILVKDLITAYEKIEAIKPLYEAYNTEPRVDTFEDYCMQWLKDILGVEGK